MLGRRCDQRHGTSWFERFVDQREHQFAVRPVDRLSDVTRRGGGSSSTARSSARAWIQVAATSLSMAWRSACTSISGSGSIPITVWNSGARCTTSTPGPRPTSIKVPVPSRPISASISREAAPSMAGAPGGNEQLPLRTAGDCRSSNHDGSSGVSPNAGWVCVTTSETR